MQQNPCCPNGSDPAVCTDYQPNGKYEDLNGMRTYITGNSQNVIIVITDIFGLDEGSRVKEVCDQLAKYGYKIIIPDIFHGKAYSKDKQIVMEELMEWAKQFPADYVKNNIKLVKDYAIQQGGKRFALIGICWGCWAAWQVNQDKGFECGINWHPSVQLETFIFQKPQEQLAEGLQCPQLVLTAGNDQPNMKQGGALIEILQKKNFGKLVETYDFPEMNHGWVVRGDLCDKKVVEEIQRALSLTKEYLIKILG